MSERKRGGLDYTPRAFPGARDPDGPAPGMEDKLAKLGLLEGAETIEVRGRVGRVDAAAESKPVTKKRAELEYTPRAFPGARDPDGPAAGMEDRLIQIGLVERTEAQATQPSARPEARPAPPPARREQPAAPPPTSNFSAPAPARSPSQIPPREPSHSNRTAPPASSSSAQTSFTTSRAFDEIFADELAAAAAVYSPSVDAPRLPRVPPERVPRPAPVVAEDQAVDAPRLPRVPPERVPRPAPVVAEDRAVDAPPAPRVQPERAPRPAPVVAEARDHDPGLGSPKTGKPKSKPAPRAARGPVRIRPLADKEERTRLSLRLAAAVDEKLDDLAHLRGLDRNTAVSIAIVQDWVACFGLQARQAGR